MEIVILNNTQEIILKKEYNKIELLRKDPGKGDLVRVATGEDIKDLEEVFFSIGRVLSVKAEEASSLPGSDTGEDASSLKDLLPAGMYRLFQEEAERNHYKNTSEYITHILTIYCKVSNITERKRKP
jgi:hypothetical protein